MRLTSKFPPAKDSLKNLRLTQDYTSFVKAIYDHRRFVFGDEKPLKEIEIYATVRRNPLNGEVPYHTCK